MWEKEEGGRAGEIVEEGGLSSSLFQNLDYKLHEMVFFLLILNDTF